MSHQAEALPVLSVLLSGDRSHTQGTVCLERLVAVLGRRYPAVLVSTHAVPSRWTSAPWSRRPRESTEQGRSAPSQGPAVQPVAPSAAGGDSRHQVHRQAVSSVWRGSRRSETPGLRLAAPRPLCGSALLIWHRGQSHRISPLTAAWRAGAESPIHMQTSDLKTEWSCGSQQAPAS